MHPSLPRIFVSGVLAQCSCIVKRGFTWCIRTVLVYGKVAAFTWCILTLLLYSKVGLLLGVWPKASQRWLGISKGISICLYKSYNISHYLCDLFIGEYSFIL